MIHAALGATLERLGSAALLAQWTGPHYQLANRLAWTLWLRDHDVDAHFGYVLFHDDLSHIATPESALSAEAAAGYMALGVDTNRWPWLGVVGLPATR